jgi:hypothetical protein
MAQQEMTAKLIRSKCQPETGASTGNLQSYSAALKRTLFHTILACVKICTVFFSPNNIFTA